MGIGEHGDGAGQSVSPIKHAAATPCAAAVTARGSPIAISQRSSTEMDSRRASDRLWPILQIFLGFALFLLIDSAVFGANAYLKWIDPESGLGQTLAVARVVQEAPRDRPLVLVFGDSRMAEGFSANLANAEARRLGAPYLFVNSAVPGTTARVWRYLLRHYKDVGIRPRAVVLMTPSFRDAGDTDDPTRASDILFARPWLGLADLLSFPLSFPAWDVRVEAAESILVRGRSFHQDLEDFLFDPSKRLDKAVQWRLHGSEWITSYPGNDKSLAGLQLDLGSGVISSPTGPVNAPPALVDYARRVAQTQGAPAENEQAHRYVALWYENIARLCNEMGARLIVLRIPRGPFHSLAGPGPAPHGALAELAAAGKLTLIPQTAFVSLERPELFFDNLHLNRQGRETFSPMLANEVVQVLATP